MSARPNSKKDKGFEKLSSRLRLIHSQPDAQSANATAAKPFHGENAASIRRLYVAEYAPALADRAALVGGQDLVDVFTEAWLSARDQRGPGRPEIGPLVNVRMPEDLIARLDAEAAAHGETRAETVRRLLGEALASAPHISFRVSEAGQMDPGETLDTLDAAIGAAEVASEAVSGSEDGVEPGVERTIVIEALVGDEATIVWTRTVTTA